MRRIYSWLAKTRSENVYVLIFIFGVVATILFSLGSIIIHTIIGSWANILWLLPWLIFTGSAVIFAADFDYEGARRERRTYNVNVYDDFFKVATERDKLKKERDKLYKLRHTRTL